ncbi:hypothetical protein QWZ08_14775 [Ferruginibacter paludis]|uniref:hypothetical protein n=1 Tax=Ferruginibacter paludis TaxID=1310417 RepID=UPI0025B5098E|nr:hypothetical protein [Ferruginibacter paludis]MDN3656909.1 hypothetical protein [Ferruginibacter paludis]
MNNQFTCYSILLGILLTMLIMYPAAALPKIPDNKSVPTPSMLAAAVTHYDVSQVGGNCEGPRAMLAVTVHTKPTLGTDKNLKICFGDTRNLASQYNTAGFTGSWTVNQQALALSNLVTGAGNYQLIVKTNQGCLDTAMINLSVLPKVIADAGKDDNVE